MSLVSFIRRNTFPGKTEHNGRGINMMSFGDVTQKDASDKIHSKLDKWKEKGYIEAVNEYEDYTDIVFDRNKFGEYYRTVRIIPKCPFLLVVF